MPTSTLVTSKCQKCGRSVRTTAEFLDAVMNGEWPHSWCNECSRQEERARRRARYHRS